jgi:transcriptional regulator with XRE-family HTH domain
MHKNIKNLRERAGITQEEMAAQFRIDRSAIAKWETGCAKPSVDKLPQLARILGCTIDELYGEEEKEA